MKKLAILAVVFAGLAAFVYFYEIAGQEGRDKAKQLEESLLRLEQKDISQVAIDRKDQDPIQLDKKGDAWMLEAPLQTAADKATVDSLLRGLADAHRERTFSDIQEQDLEKYGLSDPSMRIRVKGDDQEETVLVGAKDFSGTSVYVKLDGKPEVFLTSTLLETSADKPLLDWRSKDALTFDQNQVSEIDIRRPGDELHLLRTDGQWHLTQPFEDRADEGKVSSLLSALQSARADQFVEEKPEELQKYGLAKPVVDVRLREEGQDSWVELQLGSGEGDTFYARNPQKAPVFTLKKAVHDDLTQAATAFRDLSVLGVAQDQIASLKLVRGDETILLKHQDYKWIFESPEDLKGKEALSYKFWYPLDDMKFIDILKDVPQSDRADLELEVTLSDGSVQHYRYWRAGEEAYAVCVESGRGGRISQEDFDKLQFKTADIVLKGEESKSS